MAYNCRDVYSILLMACIAPPGYRYAASPRPLFGLFNVQWGRRMTFPINKEDDGVMQSKDCIRSQKM